MKLFHRKAKNNKTSGSMLLFHRSFFLILLLVVPVLTIGQRFDGGVSLGASATQVDGDDWGGFTKIGLVAGAYVKTDVSENIGFQVDLHYIDKGSKNKKDPDNPGESQFKIKLRYVQMPFMGYYHFRNRYNIELGIAPAYLISSKILENGEELPDYYKYKPFDLSALIGFRMYLNDNISANLRFMYSVLTITDDSDPAYNHPNHFNNLLTFTLNYEFK